MNNQVANIAKIESELLVSANVLVRNDQNDEKAISISLGMVGDGGKYDCRKPLPGAAMITAMEARDKKNPVKRMGNALFLPWDGGENQTNSIPRANAVICITT